MSQIQGSDPHPLTRWADGLKDLGRQALHLLHPLVSSAMASFGVATIAVSATFRTLGSRFQVAVLSGLCMYAVLTGCVAFGTWRTNRAMNTATRVNGLLVATLKLVTLSFVAWIASITFVARDYPFALGAGTLAIQTQYLLYHQGYNLASRNIAVGMISIAAMVVIKEFEHYLSLIMGVIVVLVAAIVYSCIQL